MKTCSADPIRKSKIQFALSHTSLCNALLKTLNKH